MSTIYLTPVISDKQTNFGRIPAAHSLQLAKLAFQLSILGNGPSNAACNEDSIN